MFRRPSSKKPARPKPSRAKSLAGRLHRQRPKRKPANAEVRPGWRERIPGLGLAGRVSAACAAVAALSLALAGAYWWLSQSSALAVRSAEVLGTRNVSRLEVLRAAGIGLHSNLLSLPVARLERQLAELPWVRSARIRRIPPDAVRIQIEEEVPAYLALIEGRLFLVDHDLRPFAPLGAEAPMDLPVITGLGQADLKAPDAEMHKLLESARRALALLPPSELAPGGRLSEIHLDRVWGVSLIWSDMAAVVCLGFEADRFSDRLARAQRVVADLESRGELARATWIWLDDDAKAVVRLGKEQPA